MPIQPDTTEYLSAAQMAERYGVSTVTIWRWTGLGKIPQPVRLTERTTRWRKHEVEAYDAKRSNG
jgi:predicted DNA-binding transcriptional regulator AlpA